MNYINQELDYSVEKNETISFNVGGGFWSGTYGFTPERLIDFSSEANSPQLISFVQGKPYLHHKLNQAVLTYNNFYGGQCEPIIKFVGNGGEQNNVIQKRWLAVRIECKQSLWFSDEIFTQPDQLSAIPIEAFSLIENYSEGELMCDINTVNPNGLSALVDGDSLFGSWIKMRFLIDPDNVDKYFELDLFHISAVQSY